MKKLVAGAFALLVAGCASQPSTPIPVEIKALPVTYQAPEPVVMRKFEWRVYSKANITLK